MNDTNGTDTMRYLTGIHPSKAYLSARTGELAQGVPVLKVSSPRRVPLAPLRRVLGLDA